MVKMRFSGVSFMIKMILSLLVENESRNANWTEKLKKKNRSNWNYSIQMRYIICETCGFKNNPDEENTYK